jgi:hypothetical protein
MVKSYTQKQFEQDLEELETLINNQNGGVSSNYEGKIRHFKVVMLNNEEVDFGRVDIKDHQNPSKAAKKLLGSIATHKNLTKLNKLKLNVVFMIKETTRDSKQKIYGPYKGKYVKLTPEEMKKATRAGITFTMRPSVKLYKEKLSPMKGGGATCRSCGHWHLVTPTLWCGGCGTKVVPGLFDFDMSSSPPNNGSIIVKKNTSMTKATGSVVAPVVGALTMGSAGRF